MMKHQPSTSTAAAPLTPAFHYEDEEIPLNYIFDDDDDDDHVDDTGSVESSINDINYLHQSMSSFNNSSCSIQFNNLGGSSVHSATASVLSYESSFNDDLDDDDLDDDDDDSSFVTDHHKNINDDDTSIDSYRMNAKKQFATVMYQTFW